MNFYSIIGVVAGALTLIAFIPCLYLTVQGKIKPHRATWFIWTFLTLLSLGSYADVGATDTLWVTAGNFIGCFIMALFSLKWGVGGTTKEDGIYFTATLIAAVLWLIFKLPLVALLMGMTIDLIGGIPTLKKTYKNPSSESRWGWSIFFASEFLNLFAIQTWTFEIAAYPIYLLGFASVMMYLIFREKIQA